MSNQNKSSTATSQTHSYDWIYLALGALVMGGLVLALVGSPEPVDFAGAQQDAPSSPGGGALALPPIVNREPDAEPAPDSTPNEGTATDVPTPASPVIEIEEIDEEGETEIVPVGEEFNLETDVDTTRPVQPTPRRTNRQPTTSVTPARTVRSGGVAVWLTLAVILLGAGGFYYYQTKGNRKASLKMGEKKGKMR